MDYEQLHKDTIAKLQEMVNSGKITVEIARGICVDFVPEDEDERVRKAMIDFFKHEREEGITVLHYGVNIERIIAWLEKQGEQKPVECCADKLWTEFQKQVAYLMASSYNREYEYTKGYVEWVAQSLLGYAKNEIEQKPAWSEEDENHRKYYKSLSWRKCKHDKLNQHLNIRTTETGGRYLIVDGYEIDIDALLKLPKED